MGDRDKTDSSASSSLISDLYAHCDDLREKLQGQYSQMRWATRKLQRIANPDTLIYEVTMRSLWEAEGEHSVLCISMGPLSDVMGKAIQEFLTVNKRSDVQANYSVSVLLDGRAGVIKVPVPYIHWVDLEWKRTEQ